MPDFHHLCQLQKLAADAHNRNSNATLNLTDTPQLSTEVSILTKTPVTPTATPENTPTPACFPKLISGSQIDLFPISNNNVEDIRLLNSFDVGEQLIRRAVSLDGNILVTGHKKFDTVTRYICRCMGWSHAYRTSFFPI